MEMGTGVLRGARVQGVLAVAGAEVGMGIGTGMEGREERRGPPRAGRGAGTGAGWSGGLGVETEGRGVWCVWGVLRVWAV